MKTSKTRSKYTVLGVSAGGGALLYPFKRHLLANIEPRAVFHTQKEEQWKLNFGEIPLLKELNTEDPMWKTKVDIIISSPDCGASSIMRLSKKKILGNPRDNKSLGMVIQAINFFKPRVFLIENLPRLLSLVPKDYFEENLSDYDFTYHCHSVSEFGNSQVSRKRLIIIGTKKSCKNLKNSFVRVFKVNDIKNSSELLEAVYLKSNYSIPMKKTLAMYDYRKLPQKKNLTVSEIHDLWVGDFKDEKKWPIKTAKMNTLPGVYRLEPDKPPLTIRPADRQFRPDGYPLGIEDFKNIMGFPKKFRIYMDPDKYLYCLNKARYTIAKGSVYEIGIWFKKCIKKVHNF